MTENLSRAERRQLKRDRSKLKKDETQTIVKNSYILKVVVVLLIILAGILYWYLSTSPEVPNNEVKVAIMGREHTSNTDDVVYNSNPPTSGPHFGEWNREWDFYESELPTGGLIHNMEHGGVVVFYQPSLDDATKEQLKEFTEDNSKAISSANQDITAPIAMAAWGVYELFNSFDEAAMKRFYKRNLNHGPENVYP